MGRWVEGSSESLVIRDPQVENLANKFLPHNSSSVRIPTVACLVDSLSDFSVLAAAWTNSAQLGETFTSL